MSKLSEMFASLKQKFANNPAALAEVEAQERAELDAEQAAADEAARMEAQAAQQAEAAAIDAMRPSARFASLCEAYDKSKAEEQAAQGAQ